MTCPAHPEGEQMVPARDKTAEVRNSRQLRARCRRGGGWGLTGCRVWRWTCCLVSRCKRALCPPLRPSQACRSPGLRCSLETWGRGQRKRWDLCGLCRATSTSKQCVPWPYKVNILRWNGNEPIPLLSKQFLNPYLINLLSKVTFKRSWREIKCDNFTKILLLKWL